MVKSWRFTTQLLLLTTLRNMPFENIVGEEENAFLVFLLQVPFITFFQSQWLHSRINIVETKRIET